MQMGQGRSSVGNVPERSFAWTINVSVLMMNLKRERVRRDDERHVHSDHDTAYTTTKRHWLRTEFSISIQCRRYRPREEIVRRVQGPELGQCRYCGTGYSTRNTILTQVQRIQGVLEQCNDIGDRPDQVVAK